MYAPIRVAASVLISALPSLIAGTAQADATIEPPSHPAYIVRLLSADLAGDPPFSITVGQSFEDLKPVPPPQPVEHPKSAQKAPGPTVRTQTYDLSSVKGIAKAICDQAFGEGQWDALNSIVTMESGWRVNAEEPSSHAYGLGQALPASKMAPFGPDYLTNPATQLKWLVSYIKNRYGNPAAALSFHVSHGWY